jgi:hypothetical protein
MAMTWRAALLGATVAAGLGANAAHAATIDVTVIPPDTTTSVFTPGPHILPPTAGPLVLPLTTPTPFTTPDGNFLVSMDTATVGDVAGMFITYSVTAMVTDLTGVKGTVVLRVDQAYDVLASNFLLVTPTLIATFANTGGAVHGNEIDAQLAINGEEFGPFVAQDRFGPLQVIAKPTVPFSVASPMTITTPVSFEFAVSPMAGDAESIPFNIKVINPDYLAAHPGLVPEPSAWALMLAGAGLAGLGLRHRRAVAA